MKISLAQSAGFCFGVTRAIETALKTACSSKKVYMLGDIVHNEIVVEKIKQAGIKNIKRPGKGKNKILLIRAHGACVDTIRKARKRGYTIVDATCPMVKEIHAIVREMENSDFRIIIIGDRHHDEVHGIAGQLKTKAIIIDDVNNIPWKELSGIKRAAIVVQSTQNEEKVMRIVAQLEKTIKELKFFNTICKPTRVKQEEIKTMPLENDAMVIIGSTKSANTSRLYEISKSLNPRTYRVNCADELQPRWFRKIETVGVTAGASTPEECIKEVISRLKKITK